MRVVVRRFPPQYSQSGTRDFKYESALTQALHLSRITVLDLTLARARPTCVRHLADWGANIIRIEPAEPTADAGTHTDEILSSVGYTKDELQQMRAKGVI